MTGDMPHHTFWYSLNSGEKERKIQEMKI